MKAAWILCSLAFLSACSSSSDIAAYKDITGFGAMKLGYSIPEARTALDRVGTYYSFTGLALEYEAEANKERWYVAAQLTKTHVSAIVLTARPVIAGVMQLPLSFQECDRRYDNALETLHQEYGAETKSNPEDGTDAKEFTWVAKDRSVTLRRHNVNDGCDALSITYSDHSAADSL